MDIELGKAKEAELLTGQKGKGVAFSIAPPAPYAPPPAAPTPVPAPHTKTVVLESGLSVNVPDRAMIVMTPHGLTSEAERISSVFQNTCGMNVMKPGFNTDAITSLMLMESNIDNNLITEHGDNPDVSLNNTNTDAAPDLREDHVDFQSVPRSMDLTLVLTDSPPADMTGWIMHTFFLDGCATVCCVRDQRFIHSARWDV